LKIGNGLGDVFSAVFQGFQTVVYVFEDLFKGAREFLHELSDCIEGIWICWRGGGGGGLDSSRSGTLQREERDGEER
jgi:hypothetical protein